MSKRIDMDKPLSEEDMAYLLSRDQHSAVAYNAARTGTKLPEDVRSAIVARGVRVPDAEPDAGGPEHVLSPDAPPDGPGAGNGQPDGPEAYTEEWFDTATIATLKPLLAERGLAVSGKREELADRLYDDMVAKGEIVPEEEESED